MDDTPEGYGGSEMLLFLDESLMDLPEDYKVQINKYELHTDWAADYSAAYGQP